ncbi:MAG: chemotaxis protein [Proteobacteria bacterium]|nr:chemotaxis protein [Pseudomonadota bacterium]
MDLQLNTDLLRMQQQLGQQPKLNSKLEKTAQDFEAFYLYTVVNEMSASVETDPAMGGGGYAEQVWRDVLNENISKELARGGGIGIADSVRKQLLIYQEAQKK